VFYFIEIIKRRESRERRERRGRREGWCDKQVLVSLFELLALDNLESIFITTVAAA
jgi:hypothetical protein